MAGIVSYGAYIPWYRLGKETAGWNLPIEKPVANFDEDSITMAVAASLDCVNGFDRDAIDALFWATTTSPYIEKQGATIAAAAVDLRRDILTSDITNSLRAGTTAMRSALDAIAAGTAKHLWWLLPTVVWELHSANLTSSVVMALPPSFWAIPGLLPM